MSREDWLPLLAFGRRMRSAPLLLTLLGLVSALALVLCLTPDVARAGVSATPSRTFVTDGSVNAVVPTTRAIYIGGNFGIVGPRTGPGVGIRASTGKSTGLAQVAGAGRVVRAVVADGSGGFYIGGNFSHVGGVTRGNLAHILADGRVDPGFHPDPGGGYRASIVDALAVSGQTLYVGGRFDSIGGRARTNLAALDATTGRATSWNPQAGGTVDALAVSGQTVYAGGKFDSIRGQPRENIGAIDVTTGDATSWNPQVAAHTARFDMPPVAALAVSGSTVYIGGNFDSVGGQPRSGVAALDATTGQATSWNPAPNYPVDALRVSGRTVYVGGVFTSIGGERRNHVAALDATSGEATPWNPNAQGLYGTGRVDALAVSDSTVYVGGDFASIGGQPRKNLAALDAATGKATSWNPRASGSVYAIRASGKTIYAGGAFNSIGHLVRRSNLAALDPKTGAVTSWDPEVSGGRIVALAVLGNTVYAGGDFGSIGGIAHPSIAAMDATTGKLKSWDPHPTLSPGAPPVEALVVSDRTVYVGGYFTSIGGKPRNNLAALDATTGDATNWNPNVLGDSRYRDGFVFALAVSGNTVYAGGDFASIGSQPRNAIAAIDATTGKPTAWNPNVPSVYDSVWTLAVSGQTVYAGGNFDAIGGKPRKNIAALDAATGMATSWNPSAYYPVSALAVAGSTIYAAGEFNSIGGQSRNHLAALDATTGKATPWNPSPIVPYETVGNVDDLAIGPDGSLWAGGAFTGFPTVAQSGIAKFAP